MSVPFFAGAYAGDASGLPPDTKLECKICWYVYEPISGDEVWQIPSGTAFADLPEHWSCPQCGAPKQDFLLVDS